MSMTEVMMAHSDANAIAMRSDKRSAKKGISAALGSDVPSRSPSALVSDSEAGDWFDSRSSCSEVSA
jgi:hypothetical protein